MQIRSRRAKIFAVATLLGVGLLAVGLVLASPGNGTVSVSAAPAGHIAIIGKLRPTVGSKVTIDVWPTDPANTPGLLVNEQPVALVVGPAQGHWSYVLTVTGNDQVQATFGRLGANVRVIDADAGQALESVSGSNMVFARHTAVLDTLAVGDILGNGFASGRKEEILVRVTGIHQDGLRTTVDTEPVNLTDAVIFASVDLTLPLNFTPGTASAPILQAGPVELGVQPVQAGTSNLLNVNLNREWSGEGNGASGKATLSGNVTIQAPELKFTLEAHPQWSFPNPIPDVKVDSFGVTVNDTASAYLNLDSVADYDLHDSASFVSHDFPPICVPIAVICVPVVPHLDAGATLDIAAHGDLTANVTASGSTSVGVQWNNQFGWSPVMATKVDVGGKVVDHASAGVIVKPVVSLSARVLGLCGPYFEVNPGFLDLEADIAANPWWHLDSGISASGGAECSFTNDKFSFPSVDLFRRTVATAGGPLIAQATTDPNPETEATNASPSNPPSGEAPSAAPSDPNGATSITCDDSCVNTGAWTTLPQGIDEATALGIGTIDQVAPGGASVMVNFGGRRIAVGGSWSGLPSLSYSVLNNGAVDPRLGTRPGQPVLVSGGTPPPAEGTSWPGATVRVNWWDGPSVMLDHVGIDALDTKLLVVGTLIDAEPDHITVRVGTTDVTLAVHNQQDAWLLGMEAPSDISVPMGFPTYQPERLTVGSLISVYGTVDGDWQLNPLSYTEEQPSIARCMFTSNGSTCHWKVWEIYTGPTGYKDGATFPWWSSKSYSWTETAILGYQSEVVGEVERSSSDHVYIQSWNRIVDCLPLDKADLPLVGTVVKATASHEIDATGQLQECTFSYPDDPNAAFPGGKPPGSPSTHVLIHD